MKSMAVALGGAIGAVLRYSIGVLTAGSDTFPYGTVTVNLAGSFGIALAYCFFQSHHIFHFLCLITHIYLC